MKKKAARIFFISAGVFVLTLAIAVIVLLQSPVQTWLARKVAARQQGYDITIGRVDAGLGGIEITNVRVKGRGFAVDLPQASVEIPLLGLIREKVEVKKLVAKGWTLDLAHPGDGATPAQPVPPVATPSGGGDVFGGIFEMLRLPVELAIDGADLQGTILLPSETPGSAPVRAGVGVRGGGLRAGNDGRFDFALDAAIAGEGAPVSSIGITGNLVVRMGTPREIQSLAFETDARASGAQFPQGARLRVNVAASKNASGEDYVASLKSQGPNSEKDLVHVKAGNPAGPEGLNAMWVVDLRDADFAPFTSGLGLKLPAFTATGQGTFSADDAFKGFHASGKLAADVSRLETIVPSLSALGPLNVAADFDVMSEGDLLRIGVLSADIASASPVASVKTLQLVEINTATGEIKVPNLQSDLVRVDIHGLPLAWAEPFARGSGFAISGEPLRGSFTGRAQGAGYSLRSVTPLALPRLSVSGTGGELAKDVEVSTAFEAGYSDSAWNLQVSNLSIRSNGAALVSVPEARAGGLLPLPEKGGPQITLTGCARVGIPAILTQPAAAGLCALTSGAIDADFSGGIGNGLVAIAAKVAATGLRAGDTTLPEIAADVRADLHDGGACDIEAPLVFNLNGRKSDIQIGAALKPDGARQKIDASITADAIHIEDLMPLASVFPAGAEASPGAAPEQPQTGGALWDGIAGQVKFVLKKVVYSPDIQAANVAGTLTVSPSLLSLENLRALLQDGAEMKASGSVKYDAAAYATDAKVTLTDFDPAPFLKAANPDKKPVVEGRFDVTGSVSGTAASLDKIASTAAADLTLTNRGGKFNGFALSAQSSGIERLLKTASSSSTLGAIGGAVLSMIGKGDNGPNLDKVKAGARVLERLAEINFDQINLDASYRPGRDVAISNFGLLSPDMRISGAGSLGGKPALSLFRQALSLDLQLAVRGQQAEDLRALGLLKKEADTLGYIPLVKDFTVDGTLGSLGASTLVTPIMNALMSK